jgi:hypothetical protein
LQALILKETAQHWRIHTLQIKQALMFLTLEAVSAVKCLVTEIIYIQQGKEYELSVGGHTAIVRLNKGEYEYLEL